MKNVQDNLVANIDNEVFNELDIVDWLYLRIIDEIIAPIAGNKLNLLIEPLLEFEIELKYLSIFSRPSM